MVRLVAIWLLLLPECSGGDAAEAQAPESVGSLLRGRVISAGSGREPVSFALVTTDTDNRIFTSASGHFSLRRQDGVALRFRIQQVGFAPKDVVIPADSAVAAVSEFVLEPRVYRLPDLVANAPGPGACIPASNEPGEGATEMPWPVEEALLNAAQIHAIERHYPVEYRREHVTVRVDQSGAGTVLRWDTVVSDSRYEDRYRRGRVVGRGRRTDPYTMFSVGDIAAQEFLESHCFQFVRTDSTSAGARHRVAFRPTVAVKSPDWAGTLLVDAASGLLVAAEAELVGIPRSSTIAAARCTVTFVAVGRTRVEEDLLECETRNRRGPNRLVLDLRKRLSSRFVGPVPGGRLP